MSNGKRLQNGFMQKINVTKEGLKQLKTEYEKLKVRRPDAVRELSRARELGDLSENSLYHAAKARLRSIDSQLRRLSNQIKLARVIQSKKYLVEQNGQQVEYEIVGDFEANPSQNKISAYSPIGRSLIGRKPGDEFEISTPSGPLKLIVLKSD